MEKIAEHESDYKFHLEMTIGHSLTLSQEINKLKTSLDVSVAVIMQMTSLLPEMGAIMLMMQGMER